MFISPVVLCGGYGTRLKPISTNILPKQFISFFPNGESLFINTIKRIRKTLKYEKIIVVCNYLHVNIIKEQLVGINENNYTLIIEEKNNNTFSSVLFALKISETNDLLCVFPSDSFIKDVNSFSENLQSSIILSYISKKHILFGIKPTYADTNYGYLKINNNINYKNNLKCFNHRFYKIETFTEKPNKEKAENFLLNGNYLWNSGSFIFNINSLIDDIKKYRNFEYKLYKNSDFIINYKENYIPNVKYFNIIEKVPIDIAIVEKSKNLLCCKANFDWKDSGTWKNLFILLMEGNMVFDKNTFFQQYNNCL